MNVEVVRWPADAQRLAELREQRVPRLLVVTNGNGEHHEMPIPVDCLEDWVTSDAPEWEIDARRNALVLRSGQHAVRPTLDDDGLLHHRDDRRGVSRLLDRDRRRRRRIGRRFRTHGRSA